MSKFRKKPVVIEARQFTGTNGAELVAWMGGFVTDAGDNHEGLLIGTLEGTMHASPGDWIIRGVKGEFYPCKPDVFEATYEPVDAPQPRGGLLAPAVAAAKEMQDAQDRFSRLFAASSGPGQNTPVSAPSGPSAGLEGQGATQETQDATEAAQRRVERWAEELWRACRVIAGEAVAKAAIAVADQEHAEKDATIADLRAEVERLRKPTVAAVMGYELGAGDLEHAEARVAELEAIVAKARAMHSEPYPGAGWCAGCHDGSKADEHPCATVAILDAPKDGGAAS